MNLFAPQPKQPTPDQLIAALIANGGSPYMWAAGLPAGVWKDSGADSHAISKFIRRNTQVPLILPPGYVFESAISMGSPAVSGIDSRGYRNPRGSKFAGQWGRGLSGLGQVSDATASQLLASVPNLQPQAAAPAASGSSVWDSIRNFFYNAATGNLSQQQVQSLQAQETQQLVQAGMPADQAASTAQADVTGAAANFTAPGGLGVTWTGALPSQPGFPTAAGAAASSGISEAASFFSQYGWWIAGGIAAIIAVKVIS